MFDASFAMLFRAIDRIRCQLATADAGLRRHLGEELMCLKRLGEQYIDHWMTLEEQIGDLFDTYQLHAEKPLKMMAVKTAPPPQSSPPDACSDNNTALASSRTFVQEEPSSLDSNEFGDVESWAWNISERVAVSFRRGLAYYDLFMFADAAKSLEQVVEASDTPVARLYLAASYAADGRSELAKKLLSAVRLSTRDDLFLCAADEIEAQLLISAGAYPDAVRLLEQIAQRIPKYPDVWFNLCICYCNLGHLEQAESVAMQAFRLDPSDNETAVLLASVRLQMGKLADAREVCTSAMNRQPQHLELLKLMASISHQQGDGARAVQVGEQMVKLYPHEEDTWSQLSWLYLQSRQPERARVTLKKQLSLFRNASKAMLQLGVLALLEHDYDGAERILMNCLANHPNKSLVWIGLGVISLSKGEDAKAHTRFLRATKDTRKEVRRLALYQYGIALIRVNRCDDAEKYLRAAASLGPPNAAITHALADVARKQGRPLEAERLVHRADSSIRCQELE